MTRSVTQLQQFYRQVFESPAGKEVMADLDRIINQTRITSDSPNPYTAVYIVAQQHLIRRVKNMCSEKNISNNNHDKEHII
jgi:ferredoxin-NADP reductase